MFLFTGKTIGNEVIPVSGRFLKYGILYNSDYDFNIKILLNFVTDRNREWILQLSYGNYFSATIVSLYRVSVASLEIILLPG